MSPRFELGDRVIISGQIIKTHADSCTRWLPTKHHPGETGVIVGRRTLRNGRNEWIDDDGGMLFTPEGDPIRAWLIAYDLHRNSIYCLDHQVERVAIEVTGGRL